MENLLSNDWIKWVHSGVPDEENDEREKIRDKLNIYRHCLICTGLSGCFFPDLNEPRYKPHDYCDCEVYPIIQPKYISEAYCDLRKFTKYIFTNTIDSKGKNAVFDEWGFKIGDSAYLKNELEEQAKQKYLSGEFEMGTLDKYGQRITINITLQTEKQGVKIFKSGWLVHPLGRITCNTPFTGYAK